MKTAPRLLVSIRAEVAGARMDDSSRQHLHPLAARFAR